MIIAYIMLDEPEYVLLQHGKAVAQWSASEAWVNFAKELLGRLDFKVEVIDANPMVDSFIESGEGDQGWEIGGLLEAVIEMFGVEQLGKPLDPKQAERLWEMSEAYELLLDHDIGLRFRS